MRGNARFAGIRRWLRLPATPRSIARDVDDELCFHVESRIQDLVARGVSHPAAEQQARREYADLRPGFPESLRFAAAGIVIGAAAGAMLSRTLSRLLFEVEPLDARTYLTMAGILALVAFAASLAPALRASRVSPMRAPRAE